MKKKKRRKRKNRNQTKYKWITIAAVTMKLILSEFNQSNNRFQRLLFQKY